MFYHLIIIEHQLLTNFKKYMKKFKPFVVGSLLAAFIIATPAMSLADNSNKNENGNQAKKVKMDNSLMNRFFGLFNRQANAYNNNLPPVTKGVTIPVISNLSVTSKKANKATLSWTTDVRASSFIWFSKTTPVDTSVKANITLKNKVLKHKIELKKLEPNTKYYVVVKSVNSAGTATSSLTSFVTSVVSTTPDTTAPVISELKTLTSDTASTISWTTNELATSQIYYSKITPVDVSSSETVLIVDNALATNHSLNITGLAKSTLYHFIVKSTDASNNTVTSSESLLVTNSGI
jgi:hypothetical protein